MGKVLTRLKIFPSDGAVPEELAERIKTIPGCNTTEVQEFVFGKQIVVASFICEDSEGRDFEEEARKIDGVSEVQVDEVGLIS